MHLWLIKSSLSLTHSSQCGVSAPLLFLCNFYQHNRVNFSLLCHINSQNELFSFLLPEHTYTALRERGTDPVSDIGKIPALFNMILQFGLRVSKGPAGSRVLLLSSFSSEATLNCIYSGLDL